MRPHPGSAPAGRQIPEQRRTAEGERWLERLGWEEGPRPGVNGARVPPEGSTRGPDRPDPSNGTPGDTAR